MELTALTENDETDLIVGFFDLRGFSKWSEDQNPRALFDFATELFERTGAYINDTGGYLVKSIGDAGLFVFPVDQPDQVVMDIHKMKQDTDAWLKDIDYPEVMSVKIQMGSVACGFMAIGGAQRFDVYGATVNHAAMMKGWPFSISSELHQQLNEENRNLFHRLDNGEMVN